jgi:hypothetical protein
MPTPPRAIPWADLLAASFTAKSKVRNIKTGALGCRRGPSAFRFPRERRLHAPLILQSSLPTCNLRSKHSIRRATFEPATRFIVQSSKPMVAFANSGGLRLVMELRGFECAAGTVCCGPMEPSPQPAPVIHPWFEATNGNRPGTTALAGKVIGGKRRGIGARSLPRAKGSDSSANYRAKSPQKRGVSQNSWVVLDGGEMAQDVSKSCHFVPLCRVKLRLSRSSFQDWCRKK